MLTLIAQGSQVIDIASKTNTISSISSLGRLIEIGAAAILIIGGLAFLFYLLMGGFSWITAGGDKGKVEKAREMITQGIIGLAVLASVFALYGVILRFLGIKGIQLGAGGSTTNGAPAANCSDYCAGNKNSPTGDQCQQQGGVRVANPCSFDLCDGVTYPCLIR